MLVMLVVLVVPVSDAVPDMVAVAVAVPPVIVVVVVVGLVVLLSVAPVAEASTMSSPLHASAERARIVKVREGKRRVDIERP